jgi:hypothetical protein
MIKIKRKIMKEAEAIPGAAQTIAAPATSDEKSIDTAAVASKLLKFSQRPDTSQDIAALAADFKLLTGDQRYISLAQFLTSIGIKKADVQAAANKMTT